MNAREFAAARKRTAARKQFRDKIIAQEKLAKIQAAAAELLAMLDAGAQDAQPGKFGRAVEQLRKAMK